MRELLQQPGPAQQLVFDERNDDAQRRKLYPVHLIPPLSRAHGFEVVPIGEARNLRQLLRAEPSREHPNVKGILKTKGEQLPGLRKKRPGQAARPLRGPEEVDLLMSRDTKEKTKAPVMPRTCHHRRFINNQREIATAAHTISRPTEKLRELLKFIDQIKSERPIANTKAATIIRRRR